MKVSLAVLADAANTSDTGKLNLLGVFRQEISRMSKQIYQNDEYPAPIAYQVVVHRDERDGKVYYLAMHPELDGCMAQGEDWEEAVLNLDVARREYIETLEMLGVPVPNPTYAAPPSGWMRVSVGRYPVLITVENDVLQNADNL